MKIRIDYDENLEENEIIIRCNKLDKTIQKIQQTISDITTTTQRLSFYKEDKEYYLSLDSVLFFETEDSSINAHTIDEVYQIKHRLYELEKILPYNFIRISKSTILNANQIFSISRNLTSISTVQFYKSHKQVYVSRYYYKELKQRLAEGRNYEN